jgi:hypothetical protein
LENVTPALSLALLANVIPDACSSMTAVMITATRVLLQWGAVIPHAATISVATMDVVVPAENVVKAKPVQTVSVPAHPNVKGKPVATMVAAAYVVNVLLEALAPTTTVPKTCPLVPVVGTRINPVPQEANAS